MEFLKNEQPANHVVFNFQDSRGFVWGVSNTLAPMRYDGNGFEVFEHDPADPTSASDGSLWADRSKYVEDRSGKIWIIYTTNNQLDRYDPKTEKFEHFRPRLKAVSGSPVYQDAGYNYEVFQDSRGFIWIGTNYGIFKYDPVRDSILFRNLERHLITLVFEDREQNIWVNLAPYNGKYALAQIHRETGQIIRKLDYPVEIRQKSNNHQAILVRADSSVLLLIEYHLFQLFPQTSSLIDLHKELFPNNEQVYTVWGGGDSILMGVSPPGKLLYYFPASKKTAPFYEWPEEEKSEQLMPFMPLRTKDGCYWAVTSKISQWWVDNYQFIPQKIRLDHLPYPASFPERARFAGDRLVEFDGQVYLFDPAGLRTIRPGTKAPPNLDLSLPGIADPWAMRYQFETDRYGYLWMVAAGRNKAFIRKFDKKGAVVFEYESEDWAEDEVGYPMGRPNSLKIDKNGILWMATEGKGVMRFDPTAQTFQVWGTEDIYSSSSDLLVDPDNNIWCASAARLSFLDQRSGKWTHYDAEHYPFTGAILSLLQDTSGNIWMGTYSGLFKFDVKRKEFLHYGRSKGVKNGSIFNLFEDQHHQLWGNGDANILYQYDEKRDVFLSYGPEEGVQLVDCGDFKKDKNGTIFLETSLDGIHYFKPEKLNLQPAIPEIHFTDLFLFNQKVKPLAEDGILPMGLDFVESIQLRYDQNDFAIHFTAPEYTHPEKLRFFIKLDGFHKGWQDLGNSREARFTNLSPGKYTFKVKVRNYHFFESETPRSLAITILPPWYRTNLAYALWISLILGTIYAVYRYQLRRRLAIAEAAQLKELDQAKTRLYTNITHEFRTPLTVILGMAEQVKSDPKNWFNEGLRLIGRNGKHLLHLVNQLLDLSKLESGSMPFNLVHGDVVSYLQYLTESFYSYADSKDIRLHFQTDLTALEMDHDPEKLQHIVANLLSNAIKFTPAGGDVYIQCSVLSAQFSVKGEEALQVKVSDTGFGIAPEHLPHIFDRFYQADASATRRGEGTGIGLALTKELVKVMGGEIEVESAVGKGTKFSIQLPVTHTAQAQPSPAIEHSDALLATALVEEESPVATPPVEPSDRYTVLLVEDNQDVITYLSSILSLYYSVETARNGREGIAKALELTPDLIVSDVMMPDTDGFELCQTLKTDERSSHIPIILLTAKADQAAKVEGLSYGADAYLTKPFHKEELLVRVEKLIEQRRKLQEKYRKAGSLRPLLQAPAAGIDDTFLQKAIRHIETHLSDEEYGMPQLCKGMNMSRSNLFRKLKALTGKSATDLIRTMRLEKAKELLETTEMSVSEVCYAVGFNNTSYFSTAFREAYGVAPSEVRG